MSWIHNFVCPGDRRVALRQVAMVHFGTTCATFSRARRNNGGPPPLRSSEFLFGIPGIPLDDMIAVQQGTSFLELSLEWGDIVLQARGFCSLENPESSMLWLMPQTISFVLKWSATVQELCMCAFGSRHKAHLLFTGSRLPERAGSGLPWALKLSRSRGALR